VRDFSKWFCIRFGDFFLIMYRRGGRGGWGGSRGRPRSSKEGTDLLKCVCPYNEFIAAGIQQMITDSNQAKEPNPNIINAFNKVCCDYAFDWSFILISLDQALQSIQKSPIPIKSIDDIKRLKYVGAFLSVEVRNLHSSFTVAE
jgi:hypothetical protein